MSRSGMGTVLITGGAGFIGTNVAHRYLSAGHRVILFDSLCRPGVERNAEWIKRQFGQRVRLIVEDIRDGRAVSRAVEQASLVYHFAAQVAVTTSLENPRLDFDVNLGGTINVLEAIRQEGRKIPLVFTSTNKVYGSLSDLALERSPTRYRRGSSDADPGVDETRPLDFHSPYGCSKGAADQYVLDYSRSFGMPAVVFRMSCIYGPHQMGTEDQGWIAHFLSYALRNKPVTIYGDGLQVRDILFVEDLVNAFLLAQDHMAHCNGHAFNIGGTPSNTISLVELLDYIAELHHGRPIVRSDAPRLGDQKYYVSACGKFNDMTGWAPKINVRDGIRMLYKWLAQRHDADVMAGLTAQSTSHEILTAESGMEL